MVLRFGNGIFEPIWNRQYIDHVEITVAEALGLEGRGEYYEEAGAIRDMVQNHMMQLLCLVAMEPPNSLAEDSLRDEKLKVLKALEPINESNAAALTVRGQYRSGFADGGPVPGYLHDVGKHQSDTETFVALKVGIANWRWAGVPFYLRTGKRLARKITEIAVTLKPVPHLAFSQSGSLGVRPNQLVLTIQPNEGVSLSLGAKIPGTRMIIRPVKMEFQYGTTFLSQSPEAYERLITDVMRGDATLFTRDDEVEAQWRICDPIVSSWAALPGPLPKYLAGSQGPEEAEQLLLADDRWRAI
jgi:glucose-6-phosphate 1-dehydrogenase